MTKQLVNAKLEYNFLPEKAIKGIQGKNQILEIINYIDLELYTIAYLKILL